MGSDGFEWVRMVSGGFMFYQLPLKQRLRDYPGYEVGVWFKTVDVIADYMKLARMSWSANGQITLTEYLETQLNSQFLLARIHKRDVKLFLEALMVVFARSSPIS